MSEEPTLSAFALVPVKRLNAAKSRLSPCLSPVQRRHLQTALLGHVLATLATTPGLDGVAVVSADPDVATICARAGVRYIAETAWGLNQALSQGTEALAGLGAGLIAIVPADLPELTAADVAAALSEARASGATLVVPDLAGTGTNGLVFPIARQPHFAFGPDSCRRHLAELGARPFPLASLARDLDRPEDLAAARPVVPTLETA
ncbi:2-phospho-L-lactate guanylyltransferase [Amorphus suaedae]